MKLSGYYQKQNAAVVLKTDYNNLDQFDQVFISKVFTDTPIDQTLLHRPNVQYGGTGFYYDRAPPLPPEIEHTFPDYHLYDAWVQDQIANGVKSTALKYYTDYSIGFLTRGCFRHYPFCVNKNYNHVHVHSTLSEFYDSARSKICLLDDNFLGLSTWKELL